MSHFSVAVFTDENTSVDELLEPFYEGLKVKRYIALTKEDVINDGKEKIKYINKLYKEYMKDKRAYRRKNFRNIEHLRYIKKAPLMKKWNKEKIYKHEIELYSKEEISEDGGIYATYNPNSKWDWYEIGRKMEKDANYRES